MERAFEEYGSSLAFGRILDRLETIVGNSRHIFDPEKPRKPRIGMVGEIFLRMHTQSNRDLIRTLECYGAEVVNASFAEWVNFVGYTALRDTRKKMKTAVRQLRFINAGSCFKKLIGFGVDFAYQETVLKRIYKRVHKHIDLAADHRIANIEHRLREEDLFSFDIGTEACLSIGTALEYIRHGYDGIVNVYPFACMPGMTTSAVLKPILRDFGLPYLDVPCDSGVHPGRETAIRTFMHQAFQHRKNGCCSQAAAAASGDLEMRAAEMRRHLPSI
jgi:predicted nucleotide-binding protein (sugar kinase/HSP70/actin superfamily)